MDGKVVIILVIGYFGCWLRGGFLGFFGLGIEM